MQGLPERSWADPAAYREAAADLARRFRENFAAYQDGVEPEVRAAGPRAA